MRSRWRREVFSWFGVWCRDVGYGINWRLAFDFRGQRVCARGIFFAGLEIAEQPRLDVIVKSIRDLVEVLVRLGKTAGVEFPAREMDVDTLAFIRGLGEVQRVGP